MGKEIYLEKILSKYQHSSKEDILYAMREAVELALDMAANKAKTKEVKVRNKYWTRHVVDKQSIIAIKSCVK